MNFIEIHSVFSRSEINKCIWLRTKDGTEAATDKAVSCYPTACQAMGDVPFHNLTEDLQRAVISRYDDVGARGKLGAAKRE